MSDKIEDKRNQAEIADEVTELLTDDTTDTDLAATADVKQSTKVTKAGPRSAKALAEAEAESERKAAAKVSKTETAEPKATVNKPNPAKQHSKGYRWAADQIDKLRQYPLSEAIELARKTVKVKFDPSLELHINLGVDPKQADQMVRSTVVLPAGTGKSLRVAVLAPTNLQADARAAGADHIGAEDLIAKIEKGMLDFDVLVATPDMMPKLAKLAKVLGPKGLMPSPKSGTVTTDPAKTTKEAKAGKVEFRIDKQAIIHQAIGKASFKTADLESNAKALIDAVMKAKPSAAKGTYVKAMTIASSMGPGIKLDTTQAIAASNPKNQ